jgi:hypothetical protein
MKRLVASKVRGADPVSRVYGILKVSKSTDRMLEELRGRPDAIKSAVRRPRRPASS